MAVSGKYGGIYRSQCNNTRTVKIFCRSRGRTPSHRRSPRAQPCCRAATPARAPRRHPPSSCGCGLLRAEFLRARARRVQRLSIDKLLPGNFDMKIYDQLIKAI